jgi:Sec-independent protein translocase protein TatA
MTSTTVLAVIGGMVVILVAAARIPAAAAELIRACILLVDAIKDLRSALQRPTPDASANGKTPHRQTHG